MKKCVLIEQQPTNFISAAKTLMSNLCVYYLFFQT